MSNARGVSAVEVLIVASIIVVALLGISSTLPTGYGNVDRSGKDTVAVNLAQQRIEWLRNQAFASAALAAGTTTEALAGSYAGYTRTTTIQDNTPITNVKQVTVTVATLSGRSVQLVSLIAR
jgi:Tfp pilus assembly protein PilV